MAAQSLHQLLEVSARDHPDSIAVVSPDSRTITYRELNELADAICAVLRDRGVQYGDRIGIHLTKSIASLASIYAILKAGSAYVPVDSSAPATRNGYIFSDCAVRFVITRDPERTGLDASSAQASRFEIAGDIFDDVWLQQGPEGSDSGEIAIPDGLAYVLYTSGSTGKPKGVMLTHENGLAFVDWCGDTFEPTESDVFSSHAPFHFDLSILDIYVCARHGARLVLIDEVVGRHPKKLASKIAGERITIWYSTPSILRLLLEVKDIASLDFDALRMVFFAGEVFPIKHFRALVQLWPHPRFANLYGPTETNVCTYYEVPTPLPDSVNEPVPIGFVCSGDRARVALESGEEACVGSAGELYISGPSVTHGYWNLPERSASAYFIDAEGSKWYKTGDVVRQDVDGSLVYISRRDRMIKRRGYRVELGEIEAALYQHPSISEAAVVSVADESGDLRVNAFINWNATDSPSMVTLKKHCADHLTSYMIPDRISILAELPKTSTDKIDYQKLKEIA